MEVAMDSSPEGTMIFSSPEKVAWQVRTTGILSISAGFSTARALLEHHALSARLQPLRLNTSLAREDGALITP
jgi:hypothetical protein